MSSFFRLCHSKIMNTCAHKSVHVSNMCMRQLRHVLGSKICVYSHPFSRRNFQKWIFKSDDPLHDALDGLDGNHRSQISDPRTCRICTFAPIFIGLVWMIESALGFGFLGPVLRVLGPNSCTSHLHDVCFNLYWFSMECTHTYNPQV